MVGTRALKAAEAVLDLPGVLDTIMETHNKAVKRLLATGSEVVKMRLFECLLVVASRSQTDYLKIDQAGKFMHGNAIICEQCPHPNKVCRWTGCVQCNPMEFSLIFLLPEAHTARCTILSTFNLSMEQNNNPR